MPRASDAAALSWRIEEACLNAWPALREILLDGWLVRFSEGLSRRGNSANPLSPKAVASAAAIAEGAAFYRRHGLPAIFRVPSFLAASAARQLDQEGFAAEGESCVLHGVLDAVDCTLAPQVALRPRADRIWFAAMSGLQGHNAEAAHTYRRIVAAISVPAVFASATGDDGRIAALAYGAIHNGLLCYESVITDPRQRRRGHARRIVSSLAGWARAQGAAGACLQVVAANSAARALYQAIGLRRELYRYDYRRAPGP